MRTLAAAAALVLGPSIVVAETAGTTTSPAPAPTTTEVVGGTDAPAGKWDDAAAVFLSGSPSCTGTLIAPTVALTAGHCNLGIDKILLGTNSLARAADGETIAVAQTIELQQADITVLKLATPSRVTPRAIGSGWARADIKNGATVAIVGYGATDRNASQFTNDLQEATSTITDFNCSVKPGCEQNELGAGGNGIDSCNGDSGGPLYLVTDYGDFLIGVTSRAYNDATDPCGEGGIYGRPDLLIPQIEQAAGTKVTHGPEPTAARIEVIRNDGGETVITANDPKSDSHTFMISTPPTSGTAAVRADGRVRVCMNADAPTGDTADRVVVNVTDTNDPSRSVAVTIEIAVGTNEPADGCDVDAFEGGDGDGGCCDSGGRAGGAAPLALFVLLLLRRRRR